MCWTPISTDEDSIPCDCEQGGQQRVLVLAIAVAVGQDLAGRVRLNAAQPEGQTDIADVARDIVVQRLHLLHVIGLAPDEFGGLGLHRVVGLAPFALQKCIPGADIVPALEGASVAPTAPGPHLLGGFLLLPLDPGP